MSYSFKLTTALMSRNCWINLTWSAADIDTQLMKHTLLVKNNTESKWWKRKHPEQMCGLSDRQLLVFVNKSRCENVARLKMSLITEMPLGELTKACPYVTPKSKERKSILFHAHEANFKICLFFLHCDSISMTINFNKYIYYWWFLLDF